MTDRDKPNASGKGESADDFDRLVSYAAAGDWDSYFSLATRPAFQENLADAAARTGEAGAVGPLDVVEAALGHAVRLGRINDAAALTLATACWNRRLDTPRSGRSGPGAANSPSRRQKRGPGPGSGEVDVHTGPDVLRALLRAWELFDSGNPGAARGLLAAIMRGQPSVIRTSDGARWAVPLLRQAFVIDLAAGESLLALVDDEYLGDLTRELTTAGDFSRARITGTKMRLHFETKADVLVELALAQAEAARGQRPPNRAVTVPEDPDDPADKLAAELESAAEIADLAADAAREAQQRAPDTSRVPRIAGRLAKAAAALTLAGKTASAAQRWAEAMAAGEQEPDPHRTLAELARAQVRAGLLDEAAQVIAVLLDGSGPSASDWGANAVLDPAWQAAAALVGALAERGEEAHAVAVLRMIPDFAHCHARAVYGLARAVAVHGAAEAVRVAEAIDDPGWRARALVAAVREPGAAAIDIPHDKVRAAVAGVADDSERVRLLAEYAITQNSTERRRLLADAVRQAGRAPRDERWAALTEIADVQAEAGMAAAARDTFDAALRLLARNARSWDRELYQLCLVRLQAGDTVGARETVAVALRAVAARKTAGFSRFAAGVAASRRRALAPAADPAQAAAAADIPLAVATLAAIAVAMAASDQARARDTPLISTDGDRDGTVTAGSVETVLSAAERLAAGLTGASHVHVAEARASALTALGDFAAAERIILGLLPPPDPGAVGEDEDSNVREDDQHDDDEAENGDDLRAVGNALVATAQQRAVALSDALVTAGQSASATAFMHVAAQRLAPCAWGLGPEAPYLLAELAAAQVRAGDSAGAAATAAFAATVASTMNAAFGLPAPFGSPMPDETGTVASVVDAVTALIRDAAVDAADFARAAQPAAEYARRPWQARARTLAALAQLGTDPAAQARLVALLTREQDQIWRLATATLQPSAVLDADDAAVALAVLAAALAEAGQLTPARQALDRARHLTAEIPEPGSRARALEEVVGGLSAAGDHAAALSTARAISHPGYKEQAMAAAIAAAAAAGAGFGAIDLAHEAAAITDPGWRAVALVAIALADGGPPMSLESAQGLIREVAHGDPRTRVWREVIRRYMTAGRYETAVDLTDAITDNVGLYLSVLAAQLGLEAADDGQSPDKAAARAAASAALLRLLPGCARYIDASYAACTALAAAFPAAAASVAEAVAQHASTLTAAIGGRSRG